MKDEKVPQRKQHVQILTDERDHSLFEGLRSETIRTRKRIQDSLSKKQLKKDFRNYIQVFGIYSYNCRESLRFLRNVHMKSNTLTSKWQDNWKIMGRKDQRQETNLSTLAVTF